MKLALLVSLASDRRSGRVHGDVQPADKAVGFVKDIITSGKPLDPRFPIVAVISLESILRQHRFRVSTAEIEAFEPEDEVPSSEELEALHAFHEKLQADLEKLKEDLQKAQATGKELETENAKLKLQLTGFDLANGKIATLEAQAKELNDLFASRDATIADLQAQLEKAMEPSLSLESEVLKAGPANSHHKKSGK